MHFTEIIKYPILTEKSSQKSDMGVYTFAIDKRARKDQVKRVVEFIFGPDVKVAKVNIMTIRKKPKKLGKFAGFKSGYKKAIVTLKSGSIPLFSDDKQFTDKVTEKLITNEQVDNKNIEISDVEKRVAAKLAAKTQVKETKSAEVNDVENVENDNHQDEEK